MRAWAGRSEDELAELGERLFVQGIAGSLYPEAWRLVTAHLRAGHTVVLASSATRFQVEPAARALGVEHVLVSPVEIVDGICTGRAGGPLLWRAGKAQAVQTFAARARHRPRAELRLLQRRRGRALPAHRRPAAGAQPRPRAGRRRPALLLAGRPVPAARRGPARGTSPAPQAASAGCSGASRPGWRSGRSAAPAARRSTWASPSAASSAARWPGCGSTWRAPSTWRPGRRSSCSTTRASSTCWSWRSCCAATSPRWPRRGWRTRRASA